ncbi:hypothetical protein PRUPE_1G488800 [Prunus persica]|uniref:Uncharacterized protein n=1 Tax=Prunus persica TaxID=3760 RepID=A0A251RF22_PRUPE|nr:uncharacterized protein LOC18788548 [Prunus persica]XP_020410282.1 uncharacterized protein LOC18788548 [Prunus persica]ONI34581.1 hypothetical protein PRUPE_1G488800 [Prunus persica]ONI34582.1 hypothetical protein PRUPE_1G488800 [Prunus persica]
MAPYKGIRELNSLKKDYEGDCEDDKRLARRRKRKCIADRNFEPKSWFSATKKRRDSSIQGEEEMADKDFEKSLNGLDLYGDWVDDDVDPDYKKFLENLTEDGSSYVLVVVRENENLELIKFEQEDGELDETILDTPETLKKSQMKKKTEIKKALRGGIKREQIYCFNDSVIPLNKEEFKSPRSVRYAMSKKTRGIQEDSEGLSKKKSSGVKKNVNVEAPDPVSDRTKGRSNKIHGLEVPTTRETLKSYHVKKKNVNKKGADGGTKGLPVKTPHLAESGHNHGAASDQIDTDMDYQEFLDGLRKYGGKVVYTPTTGGPVAVVLEEDVESKNEYFTSFTAVDVDSGWCVETCDTSHAQFRKGLMKDLKRPYDQEEYKRLLKELTLRRPINHDRNLRNGRTKSYPVAGKLGASYREQHIVLARKIDAAGSDRPRILNLLRGFFYWLKNVAQEGCFCPWSDSSCLKLLPQADRKRKFSRM